MKASFYGEITDIANQAGVPTLIDSSKDYILQALPYKPSIVKMNWEEFQWTFQREANNIPELIQKAQQVYEDKRLNALVLTLGINGILAFSKEGIYLVTPPIQQAVNAAGAGDAVSSALTWRLSLGDKWEQALRWGAATSAAVVLTEGTADCHMEDILRIMPEVVVNRINT
jgi:fructose-1-phosphate kinase PfkB-like protein